MSSRRPFHSRERSIWSLFGDTSELTLVKDAAAAEKDSPYAKDEQLETRSTSVQGSNTVRHRTVGDDVNGKFDACLRRTCLRPNLSLRNQLFISFGIVSTLCLAILIVAAILILLYSGANVKELSREDLEYLTEQKLSVAARIKAESLTAYIEQIKGLSLILVETTKDRFVGYPDHPGYADDSLVPFKDVMSGRNKYPLKASTLLPLDWEYEPIELTDSNYAEYAPKRRGWYDSAYFGAEAVIMLQGACDPNVTDPALRGYFSNCTDANNDITVGGVVHPTSTFQLIHRKVSDYATAVLKPLFEFHSEVFFSGIFFANSGAGLYVAYPALTYDGWIMYTSIGCDWLLEKNPINNSRTIGTEEMVARCHPNGTEVENYYYNPLERAWCREQALDPSRVHFFGPYIDAVAGNVTFTTGQAVYDRVTNEFIACTLADVNTAQITEEIERFVITESSDIHFVKWNDGTVVASSKWSATNASSTTIVSEIDSGLTLALFAQMKELATTSYHTNREQSKFETLLVADEKVFAMYPVPVPPKTYDPDYVPEFAIILSLTAADVYAEVNALDDYVTAGVSCMIQNVVIGGAVGLVVIVLSISVVSMYLTKPMEWIARIGDKIVSNLGSQEDNIDFESKSAWMRCSPRTEVSLLTEEFQKMVKEFSGSGTAKLHTYTDVELKNPFDLHNMFASLYSNRNDTDFVYKYKCVSNTKSEGDTGSADGLNRIYVGPNLPARFDSLGEVPPIGSEKVIVSRLFWWILSAIAFPLALTMFAISVYVSISISTALPNMTDAVKEFFVSFEQESLYPLAEARAAFSTRVIKSAFRDAHLLSRISGWLFFGAIQKAQSMTSMTTAAEKCKATPTNDYLACPYVQNRTNTPCDCKWNQRNDAMAMSCLDYQEDSRFFQQLWWYGSSQDAWPNGDVNFTSFPNSANSPTNTSWYREWSDVPGAELGLDATGSDTAFEMLVYLSALSMVQIPLFNYQRGSRNPPSYSFTAFERTGMLSGYTGCEPTHPFPALFQYDETTGNYSSLCPNGKYGYDPRCSSWYQGGEVALADGDSVLYATQPSRLPLSDLITQTIAVPIKDENRLIGENAVNFNLNPIFDSLTQRETPLLGAGFHVLISASKNGLDAGTVIGPNFDSLSGETQLIQKSVLPFDVCENDVGIGCENLIEFQKIVSDMQMGKSGKTRFNRRTKEGGTESVIWVFAPVTVDRLRHLNHSDMLRGVVAVNSTLFSLALASPEPALYHAFNSLQNELDTIVRIGISVLAIVIALTTIGLGVMSARVSMSVTLPISKLRMTIARINNPQLRHDRDDEYDGSTDVTRVRQAIERLHTALPIANAAFFSGDLKSAYEMLNSALLLFEKLNNEKAIGIANNNLGNIMLSMYRTMKATNTAEFGGFSLMEVVRRGESYFKCAIDGGEYSLARIETEEGWSSKYLVFMQQLSNRYFNRAVFHLVVKDYHTDPEEALRLGLLDLSTARDMDREVIDNGDANGFNRDPAVVFELLISRMKGLHNLISLGYQVDWDIDELVTEAHQTLSKALLEPGHDLFRSIKPIGQVQRLEATLIEHFLLTMDYGMAASIAIRMLIEDDYIFSDATTWAIKGLLEYLHIVKNEDLGGHDPSDVRSSVFQYRQQIAVALATPAQSLKRDGRVIMMRVSAKQTQQGDVSLELF